MILDYMTGYMHGQIIGIAISFIVLCIMFREVRDVLFAKVMIEEADCDEE